MRALPLLFLCLACAPSNRFTRPEELEEIAKAPVPEVEHRKIASVAEWELQGPLPDRVEHTQLSDASDGFTQLVLANGKGRFQLTQDLTCVSRERARFTLAHDGAAPGVLLRAFIEARCGTPSVSVRTWDLYGDVPDDVPDAELVKQWSKAVTEALPAVPDGAFAGIALQRSKGKARLVLSWARDEARLDPISIYPESDVVRVRGQLLVAAETLWARINQGEGDSAECVKNPDVKLPRFELACPVKPGSPHDWLGIWVREPGRFLGYPVLTTMVWSPGAATSKFVRPDHGLARDGSAEAFLEALNTQRTRLGRVPLVMSAPQAEQARSLVAPYVAAQLGGDAAKIDRIAMGLIAGWRVQGAVTEGNFTSAEVPAEAATELLAALLELPGGRHELLSKEARVLALGQIDRGGLIDSLICTYSLLDEPTPTVARQQALFDRLNAERKRRGLPPAQWVQLPTKTSEEVATAVREKGLDPADGIERLMADAVQIIRQPVKGWRFYASSLDEVTWPDELLERPTLQVMMTIAPFKRQDTPWTQYVFMVVLFEGASTTQA